MNEPKPIKSESRLSQLFRSRLAKRVVPLALLGSAGALVVAQLSKAVVYEVELSLQLPPQVIDDLEKIELLVLDEHSQHEPVTVILFSSKHHLRHQLRLTAGRYSLFFKIFKNGEHAHQEIKRWLDVSSDFSVIMRLP